MRFSLSRRERPLLTGKQKWTVKDNYMATVLNTENGKGYNVCENNYIYSPEWLKKIKFKLAPQTISCQLFLALGKL